MYVKVKVVPSSKKESFEKQSEDTFSVHVKEPAERNLANKRVVLLVSEHFGASRGKVRIVSGHRSRSKILSVDMEQ